MTRPAVGDGSAAPGRVIHAPQTCAPVGIVSALSQATGRLTSTANGDTGTPEGVISAATHHHGNHAASAGDDRGSEPAARRSVAGYVCRQPSAAGPTNLYRHSLGLIDKRLAMGVPTQSQGVGCSPGRQHRRCRQAASSCAIIGSYRPLGRYKCSSAPTQRAARARRAVLSAVAHCLLLRTQDHPPGRPE